VLPIAQHRDPVAQTEDLLQAVRNVDERGASGLEPVNQLKERSASAEARELVGSSMTMILGPCAHRSGRFAPSVPGPWTETQ